jgi:hypothetical protein
MFLKYKEVQENRQEKDTCSSRSPSTSKKDSSGEAMFFAMGNLFVLIYFCPIFFLQFPPFLDPFFRLLMLLIMYSLGYQIVLRAATMLGRFELEGGEK